MKIGALDLIACGARQMLGIDGDGRDLVGGCDTGLILVGLDIAIATANRDRLAPRTRRGIHQIAFGNTGLANRVTTEWQCILGGDNGVPMLAGALTVLVDNLLLLDSERIDFLTRLDRLAVGLGIDNRMVRRVDNIKTRALKARLTKSGIQTGLTVDLEQLQTTTLDIIGVPRLGTGCRIACSGGIRDLLTVLVNRERLVETGVVIARRNLGFLDLVSAVR